MHRWPAAQLTLHPPQWLTSLRWSRQSSPQVRRAAPLHGATTLWHVGDVLGSVRAQIMPAGHALPQRPQSLGSAAVLAQRNTPSPTRQLVYCGDGHAFTQAPAAQACHAGQALPQRPQCALAVVRFAQVEPQSVSPG